MFRMSCMLITDIKANVSPKRIQIIEQALIRKLKIS
jgi:hypothetical protein